MSRIRLLITLLIASFAFLITAAASANTVWIVRDGFYAGIEHPSTALTYFYVKEHRVYHLRFSLNLSCHNSNTGEDYIRNFNAGPRMPQGKPIRANGRIDIHWTEEEAGRHGNISAELSFRRHPLATFSVLAHGGYESCEGFSAIRLERSPHTPPQPATP